MTDEEFHTRVLDDIKRLEVTTKYEIQNFQKTLDETNKGFKQTDKNFEQIYKNLNVIETEFNKLENEFKEITGILKAIKVIGIALVIPLYLTTITSLIKTLTTN